MAVATQLSLFGDDDVPLSSPPLASPGSSLAKPGRRKPAHRASKVAADAMAAVAAPLFDDDNLDLTNAAFIDSVPAAPSLAVLPPQETSPLPPRVPVPSPVTRRFLDEESALPPSRIVFDATVWELRADRGDFIHIRTGEIRDEDGFVFPALDGDDLTAALDDWDIPQVVPRKAKDSPQPRRSL